MVKSESNPGGLPIEVFDGFRASLAANRAQFYIEVPSGPFYGFNRPGAEVSQGLIDNWWRQGMRGAANAHYECIKAFSETDFTEDLKSIEVPVLVAHGTDDQIVPYEDAGPLGEAPAERQAEELRGLSPRHALDASGRHQSRPPGLREGVGAAPLPIRRRAPGPTAAQHPRRAHRYWQVPRGRYVPWPA